MILWSSFFSSSLRERVELEQFARDDNEKTRRLRPPSVAFFNPSLRQSLRAQTGDLIGAELEQEKKNEAREGERRTESFFFFCRSLLSSSLLAARPRTLLLFLGSSLFPFPAPAPALLISLARRERKSARARCSRSQKRERSELTPQFQSNFKKPSAPPSLPAPPRARTGSLEARSPPTSTARSPATMASTRSPWAPSPRRCAGWSRPSSSTAARPWPRRPRSSLPTPPPRPSRASAELRSSPRKRVGS